jgi:hypothetical protein
MNELTLYESSHALERYPEYRPLVRRMRNLLNENLDCSRMTELYERLWSEGRTDVNFNNPVNSANQRARYCLHCTT